MGGRIGNLSGRGSGSVHSGDVAKASWWLQAGRFKGCLGILTAIIIGIVAILITPAGPTLASITPTLPATSAIGISPTAAGPCGDKSKRYADCGNGTVTDTETGLIWLKQSNCLPAANWEDAKKATAALKDGACMLKDGSAPGDWRLPTEKEWEATMSKAKDLKCTGPVLTNDAGTACISAGPSSFMDVEADYYWSSTPIEGANPQAVMGDLDHGNLLKGNLINTLRVWPVRGGQR
jgi:hypothetical protein